MALRFFLGANTERGFVSLYPALEAERERRLYLLKGGPGCGKATCIRWLAEQLGGPEEWIACSSDPDSLDGAILPQLALLDGTAPHIYEPRFAGCDGDDLPLPALRDLRGLWEKREALAALKAAAGQHYAEAYRLLHLIALLRRQQRTAVAAITPAGAAEKRAAALLRSLVPKGEGKGSLRQRFLEGFTPRGELLFAQTVTDCADRIIALQDRWGLAQSLLERLRDGALAREQTVYACLDPLEPERLQHLLLPEARTAFATVRWGKPALPVTRSIHLDALPEAEALRKLRPKLRQLRRMEEELLAEATASLAAAHALHDRMEQIYRPHLCPERIRQHYEGLLRIVTQNT